MKTLDRRKVLYLALLYALLQPIAAAQDSLGLKVVSVSEDFALGTEDAGAYLLGRPLEQLIDLRAKPAAIEELILDLHSDFVLAHEAEAGGLNERADVASQLADYRRQVLIAALMRDVSAKTEVPSDLEGLAHERYLLKKELFKTPERRRVAHILLGLEDGKDQALRQALTIRERLDAGEDFSQLAAEFSKDSTSEGGGEVPGPFARDGRLVKEFEDALFALKSVGDVSTPVETRFGIHLIKLLAIEPAEQIPFEKVKANLVTEIQTEIINSALAAKRGEAYPAPDTINIELMRQLVEEEIGRRSGAIEDAGDSAQVESK